MDIVDILTEHHRELRRLGQQAMADPSRFDVFLNHLVIHHTMEEKYFYDFLVLAKEGEHDALEAVNEHHILELILKDAEGFPKDHAHFPVKVEGLKEYLDHHLDEEEQEIFPLGRQLMDGADLERLGRLFQQAKEAYLSIDLPDPGTVRFNTDSTGGGATGAGLGIGSLK